MRFQLDVRISYNAYICIQHMFDKPGLYAFNLFSYKISGGNINQILSYFCYHELAHVEEMHNRERQWPSWNMLPL